MPSKGTTRNVRALLIAKEALEAAAPIIRAQALEDAALDFRHWGHVFETLRARAAAERGGE